MYLIVFSIIILTSYFSFFLSIVLIALLLVFFENPIIRGGVALFSVISLSYLQSDFIPDSDSLQYLNYFKSVYFNLHLEEQLLSRTLEFAWQAYILALSKVIHPEFFFFFNTLALYSLAMFVSYKLDSGRGTYLMIFLLFCFLGFSNNLNFLIRQYYASIFIVLFFIYWEKCTFKKVSIYMISLGFHLSSVIYLPLLSRRFVSFLNKRTTAIIIFSFACSFLISLDTISFIYQKFQGSIIVDRLRYYDNSESSSSIFSIYFLEKILVIILVLKVELNNLTRTERYFRALLIYSFSISLIFANIAVLSERLGMIYTLFLGLFLFIPIKYFDKISFFKIKVNPILIFYFYLPLRIVFWGVSNENTHIINYFNGNILSVGFNSFFS